MESFISIDYGGYRFDRRLRARYAVGFDWAQWNWEYESPYFILHDVKRTNSRCKDKILEDHIDVLVDIITNDSMFNLGYQYYNEYFSRIKAMQTRNINVLLLGRIPDGNSVEEILKNMRGEYPYTTYFFPANKMCEFGTVDQCPKYCKQAKKKYPENEFWQNIKKELIENPGICPFWPERQKLYLWIGQDGRPTIGEWHKKDNRYDGNASKTVQMYGVMRRARFEWGETPQIKNPNRNVKNGGI